MPKLRNLALEELLTNGKKWKSTKEIWHWFRGDQIQIIICKFSFDELLWRDKFHSKCLRYDPLYISYVWIQIKDEMQRARIYNFMRRHIQYYGRPSRGKTSLIKHIDMTGTPYNHQSPRNVYGVNSRTVGAHSYNFIDTPGYGESREEENRRFFRDRQKRLISYYTNKLDKY